MTVLRPILFSILDLTSIFFADFFHMLVKDNRLECAIQHSLRTHCSIRRRLYSVPSPISFRFHYLFCIQLLSTWKKENLLLNIANSFLAVILWSSCACLAGRLAARSPRFSPGCDPPDLLWAQVQRCPAPTGTDYGPTQGGCWKRLAKSSFWVLWGIP